MQTTGKLNIIVAVYGLKAITENVKHLIIDGEAETLDFTVNNNTIGEDGWLGQRKTITVVYKYDNGDLQVAAAKESERLIINPSKIKKPKFVSELDFDDERTTILAATYGSDDITYKLRNLISTYNTLSLTVNNEIFGDSWYGVPKTLIVVLGTKDEIAAVEVFVERESVYIDLNELVPAL